MYMRHRSIRCGPLRFLDWACSGSDRPSAGNRVSSNAQSEWPMGQQLYFAVERAAALRHWTQLRISRLSVPQNLGLVLGSNLCVALQGVATIHSSSTVLLGREGQPVSLSTDSDTSYQWDV